MVTRGINRFEVFDIVQNHTTYVEILNPSNPHKVTIKPTTKITLFYSKLDIDFDYQTLQCYILVVVMETILRKFVCWVTVWNKNMSQQTSKCIGLQNPSSISKFWIDTFALLFGQIFEYMGVSSLVHYLLSCVTVYACWFSGIYMVNSNWFDGTWSQTIWICSFGPFELFELDQTCIFEEF